MPGTYLKTLHYLQTYHYARGSNKGIIIVDLFIDYSKDNDIAELKTITILHGVKQIVKSTRKVRWN